MREWTRASNERDDSLSEVHRDLAIPKNICDHIDLDSYGGGQEQLGLPQQQICSQGMM